MRFILQMIIQTCIQITPISFGTFELRQDMLLRFILTPLKFKAMQTTSIIGDGIDYFCNSSTERGEWIHLTGRKADVLQYRDFISNTSSIKLIFTSDWSDTDLGFLIKCSSVKIGSEQSTTSTTTTMRMYLRFSVSLMETIYIKIVTELFSPNIFTKKEGCHIRVIGNCAFVYIIIIRYNNITCSM